MHYLLLDPVGDYAIRQKQFLDRLGLPAIAVFSNPMRQGGWHHKWVHKMGEHVVADYRVEDPEDPASVAATAAEIERNHPGGFYGVVPWDELHVVLAGALSDALDLGWNSRRVLERFRDKYLMKDCLRRHGGVRINASRLARNAQEAMEFQEEVGRWPIVVKPSGGAGAMSVFFAESPAELLRYSQRVLEFGMGAVLLEEYIGGDEFAVNGLVDQHGDFMATDIWIYDKRDSHGERNLYYQSVKLSTHEPVFGALAQYAGEVVEAMGLRRSPIHMEVKVDDRGPCLIEVGARMAGGDQPVLASKLHHHSLFELAVCHYLEELPLSPTDVDYNHYDSYSARIVSGIQPVEIPRIREVHGVEAVESLPSFAGFGVLRLPGMRLPVTRDLDTKSWEVYLYHREADQVSLDAHRVRQLLQYR